MLSVPDVSGICKEFLFAKVVLSYPILEIKFCRANASKCCFFPLSQALPEVLITEWIYGKSQSVLGQLLRSLSRFGVFPQCIICPVFHCQDFQGFGVLTRAHLPTINQTDTIKVSLFIDLSRLWFTQQQCVKLSTCICLGRMKLIMV